MFDIRKDSLSAGFLITQCNNAFTFYELLEEMIAPVIEQGIATEEEVDQNFNQRAIFLKFQSMQTTLLLRLISQIFKNKLEHRFKCQFLDLDMESILNESLNSFCGYAEQMSHKVQRQAWTFYLEKTVIYYIQCMLNSS